MAKKWLHEPNSLVVPACKVVTTEVPVSGNTGERPDVLGWCSWASVLIEVKKSRESLHRDLKKPFRKDMSQGIGNFRYVLCEEGIISSAELHKEWGLLYIHKDHTITIEKAAEKQLSNLNRERRMLFQLLSRSTEYISSYQSSQSA